MHPIQYSEVAELPCLAWYMVGRVLSGLSPPATHGHGGLAPRLRLRMSMKGSVLCPPQKTGSRDRTISTPSRPANTVKHQVERAQERERSVSPQKSAMRVRTVSTPSQPPASVKFKVEQAHDRERPVSPQKTGSRDRTISGSSRSNNVKFQVEQMQERERSVSPQKTGSRDRTMSTPSGPSHVARARASLSSISSAPVL